MDGQIIGAKFDTVDYTSGVGAHALGTFAKDKNGTEFVYVRSTGALTQYKAYAIDENWLISSTGLAHSDGGKPVLVGAPQVTVTAPSGVTYSYFWVAVGGVGFKVFVASETAANIRLALSSTAGMLKSAASGDFMVQDTRLTTACGVGDAGTAASCGSGRMKIGSEPF